MLLLVILSLFVGEICQNVYFDGSHLETSNRATPCQCYCHLHIRIGFLGVENPRKVVLFVILWLLVGQKCKNVFLVAAILNRPIWRPHWKSALAPADLSPAGQNVSMYQIWCFCTNLHIHSLNSLDYEERRHGWLIADWYNVEQSPIPVLTGLDVE